MYDSSDVLPFEILGRNLRRAMPQIRIRGAMPKTDRLNAHASIPKTAPAVVDEGGASGQVDFR
jgi:hypothetical protein